MESFLFSDNTHADTCAWAPPPFVLEDGASPLWPLLLDVPYSLAAELPPRVDDLVADIKPFQLPTVDMSRLSPSTDSPFEPSPHPLSFANANELAALSAVHEMYAHSPKACMPQATRSTGKVVRSRKTSKRARMASPIARTSSDRKATRKATRKAKRSSDDTASDDSSVRTASFGKHSSDSSVCNVLAKMGKSSVAQLTDNERVLYRRLKNREASQLSRDRKRQRLEVLETAIAQERALTAAMERERNAALRANAALQAELAALKAQYKIK